MRVMALSNAERKNNAQPNSKISKSPSTNVVFGLKLACPEENLHRMYTATGNNWYIMFNLEQYLNRAIAELNSGKIDGIFNDVLKKNQRTQNAKLSDVVPGFDNLVLKIDFADKLDGDHLGLYINGTEFPDPIYPYKDFFSINKLFNLNKESEYESMVLRKITKMLKKIASEYANNFSKKQGKNLRAAKTIQK